MMSAEQEENEEMSASPGESGPELVVLPSETSPLPVIAPLAEKLARIHYSTFEVQPGEEGVHMLYIQGSLICGENYALALSDVQLLALIEETIGGQS